MEIIRYQVVVPVVPNRRDHASEVLGFTKSALFDLLEDLGEIGIDGVRAIIVGVAEIFNILGKIAEEEDVVLSNLTRNFNLADVSISLRNDTVAAHTLAPSHVPIMRPPLSTNFMLLVPEALEPVSVEIKPRNLPNAYSVPAVEICSLMSEAGMMSSALLTL